MGRPLPGYRASLRDIDDQSATEGEICVDCAQGLLPLMLGYADDAAKTSEVKRNGWYHTGDVAEVDERGYLTYIGRTDDVFKSSDYRISPFELESVLIECQLITEAAVVPSPDALRLSVPKAFIALRDGVPATRETALAIFRFAREHMAPYKRVRRLEFALLPKTISGKIQRGLLKRAEAENDRTGSYEGIAFREEDFAELAAVKTPAA
ncbi:Acetyl-coenzyme A synthetase [compost metagenome]